MFTSRSRYASVPTDVVTLPDGREVVLVRFPVRDRPLLYGYHVRLDGQRLDHVASSFLRDPTAFWRLCDTAGTFCPRALEAAPLIAIPQED